MPICWLAGQINFHQHLSLLLLTKLQLNMKSKIKYLQWFAKLASWGVKPLIFQFDFRYCCLPFIKTHHHFFARGFGLAAEHKALLSFPFF